MPVYKSPLHQPAVNPDEVRKDSSVVMKLVIGFALVAVLGGVGLMVMQSRSDRPAVSAQTRDEVAKLLTMPNFNAFDQALDQKIAQAGKSGIDRSYLEALVDRVSDPTEVDTVLPPDTYLSSQLPAKVDGATRILHHDVQMIGGRATYALHKLTGKTVPSVKATDDLARLAQIKSQVAEIVLR
ncbi:MAG: hypothetical protein ACREJ2_05510 [Planctomycetota bacterium]